LRRTSLDELPQLINVLKGEMSIVGPRPPVDYEVAKYEPWQWGRLAVRPGITGLWQVSGRNRLTYHEMCETDIRYIDEWSLLGDLKIVVRTPWIMFVDGGGAE
jgi:lipopolysaccharide/colanic/teichoic acid biosynthesis glycosyltransferase